MTSTQTTAGTALHIQSLADHVTMAWASAPRAIQDAHAAGFDHAHRVLTDLAAAILAPATKPRSGRKPARAEPAATLAEPAAVWRTTTVTTRQLVRPVAPRSTGRRSAARR